LAILLPSAKGPSAHYAKFCVDAELLTSYGWIEAVGCADRSAYDLSCHTKATGVPLVVREARKEPLTVTEFVAETQKAKFGPRFKQDGKAVQSAIDQLTQDVKEKLSLELKENGEITIDVPGVGDGKVELTSGIESAPHEFPVKIANFRRTYQN
jgi:glycyl-tRNA synthetase